MLQGVGGAAADLTGLRSIRHKRYFARPSRQTGPPRPTFPSLAEFRELPEHRLNGLNDEQLIDYLRAARAERRHETMKPAIAVLVFGYHDTLRNRARLKLPDHDVADVVSETMASAVASAFGGSSVGEFRSWLHTILSRRIADYHDARSRSPKTTSLPSEHQGEDDVWGHEPGVPFEGDAQHARDCVRVAYEELENKRHRRVIDLYVFGPLSAAETAELVGDEMSEANVHQISSRFQKRVKELLEEGSDTSG
jgi:RNA polymerase sigma factor (sigma-70 family)